MPILVKALKMTLLVYKQARALLIKQVLLARGAANSINITRVNFKAYFIGFFKGFFAGITTLKNAIRYCRLQKGRTSCISHFIKTIYPL